MVLEICHKQITVALCATPDETGDHATLIIPGKPRSGGLGFFTPAPSNAAPGFANDSVIVVTARLL
ncbi:hypothetical protein EB809_03920 [Marinobacter sp. R17]|nr:hypothetical protein EB809_03920 [Marinobacter sp. R17]